jgi:hypothetical protein
LPLLIKEITVKLPFDIVDPAQRLARVRMRAPILAETAGVGGREPGAGEIRTPAAATLNAMANDAPDPGVDLTPRASDYIYPLFRALSQTVIEGYWIDYSRPGVLEASTPLLAGQTVYADHHFWNVEKWLGVVNESRWDAEGAHTEGLPGINVELKIDAFLNPRIARGLLMQPPAIHSASVTILFEYEYSHGELADEGRFWDLLGEEVAGETVRLIATKILAYWELSLVFQGADRTAKQLPPAASQMSADYGSAIDPQFEQLTFARIPTNVLTPAPAPDHDPAPDAAGGPLIDLARAECLRLARLATLGGGEGDLPAVLRAIITNAPPDQLLELTEMYRGQTSRRFGLARSSIEDASIAAPEPRIHDTTLL